MNLEDLSPELREKIGACKTPDEIIELIKNEGIELTDEQIEEI